MYHRRETDMREAVCRIGVSWAGSRFDVCHMPLRMRFHAAPFAGGGSRGADLPLSCPS